MFKRLPLALVATLAALPSPPAVAQTDQRIRGAVTTIDGKRLNGYLSFGLGQRAADWDDVMRFRRALTDDVYHAWLRAARDGVPAVRTVEVKGHRVSWEERHRDFPITSPAVIRTGRVAALVMHEGGDVGVVPRDGAAEWMSSGGGGRIRLRVEEASGESTSLRGGEIARIDFAAQADQPDRTSNRAYAAVEDRFGRTFSGAFAWGSRGRDLVHLDEQMHGEDDNGRRSDHYWSIERLRPRIGGATVTLATGEEVELYRRSASHWYRSAARVADPGLGTVVVDWDDLREIRFLRAGAGAAEGGGAQRAAAAEAPGQVAAGLVGASESGAGWESSGIAPLYGVVVDADGGELAGWIRWDAHKEWSWEHLEGESEKAGFAVEFANIRRIARDGSAGSPGDAALVLLQDGRSFPLTDASDVDGSNRGVFVFDAPPGQRGDSPIEGWRYVAWEDFREVRFEPAPASDPESRKGALR